MSDIITFLIWFLGLGLVCACIFSLLKRPQRRQEAQAEADYLASLAEHTELPHELRSTAVPHYTGPRLDIQDSRHKAVPGLPELRAHDYGMGTASEYQRAYQAPCCPFCGLSTWSDCCPECGEVRVIRERRTA